MKTRKSLLIFIALFLWFLFVFLNSDLLYEASLFLYYIIKALLMHEKERENGLMEEC